MAFDGLEVRRKCHSPIDFAVFLPTQICILRAVFLFQGDSSSSHGNKRKGCSGQGCQMAKFDPFLSLDCTRVEVVGAQSKERKGSNFAA